jgi:hypothetical protein
LKKTLDKINELLETKIIRQYAIAGGLGQFYYIEPSITYDLDLVIDIETGENKLISLEPIYRWAKRNNYKSIEEHIVIEGIPVQFLPAYNDLVSEALSNRSEIELYGVKTFILKPEYLMAIMLQTNRPKDRERLMKFLEEAEFSKENFEDILERFNLKKLYSEFRKRMK